jgi:hypothetical protein
MDFVRRWSEKTAIGVGRFIAWLGMTASKFYDWREPYGCVNEHNGWIPRDFWLELWEKKAIIAFHLKNPLEGYRRGFDCNSIIRPALRHIRGNRSGPSVCVANNSRRELNGIFVRHKIPSADRAPEGAPNRRGGASSASRS